MISVTPLTAIHNTHVLEIIPEDSCKILEIGTGSAALAREIRVKLPQVEYIGVEVSEEYSKLSLPYCNRVYVEDIENPTSSLISELASTDTIIFADVLEHLIDPWKTLKLIKENVRNGTRIIASIPNIQHWSIQYKLMLGDFRYTETGLLDQTHLRFFTRDTMIELFESTGYTVEKLIPRIFNFPNQEDMLSRISEIAKIYGLNENTCIQNAAAFQFVIMARSI